MPTALRKPSAPSMAVIRKRQREAGFYETTVSLHERVRNAIDRAIAEGRFKSRRLPQSFKKGLQLAKAGAFSLFRGQRGIALLS